MQTPLTQLRSTETREAIVVPEGETLTLYADHCKAFTKDDQLEIANVPCKVIHIAEHFVQVKPHSTADWPAEATIHQHQAHTTPEDMCQALDAYWTQFWTKEPDPPPSDLGDILQYVPAQMHSKRCAAVSAYCLTALRNFLRMQRQDWKTLLNEISAAYQTAAQQAAEWLHLCNWTHTEPDIQPGLYQAVHAVDMQGAPLSFYTDGSCQFPAHPNESYSTYSVIIDTATDDAEREQHAKHYATGQHMPCTLCSLAVARTPGEQRIHRAELYAIVYICERFQNTIVHTDSAVTLAAIRRCQNTSNPDTLHDMEDLDLVLRLWVTLHTGNRQFLKVKAHAEEDSQVPWLTLYHRLGNKRANDVAITANEFLLAPLVQEMQDMHKDLAAQRHHLAQLLRYHLEVIRRHAELKFIKQQEEATTLPEQALPTRQAVFHKLCQYQADPCWSRVAPQVQELRHCTWGPTLTAKLQDWCNQIRWPTNRADDEIQNAGLTWIEMVLSFMIFARCFLPVKRPGQEGVMMLTPIQSFAALKAYDVKLSELANLFAIFCKQLQDLQDTPIFPEVERGLVRSLYIQGAAFFSSGFRIRAVVPFQTEVLSSLQPYLLRHRGRAFVDIPEFPIEPDEAMFLQVKSELRQSWDSRTAMTHKAAR
ncbi:unnamed protein product [Cladocopium goreaui]|uniref:Uncharacterized protein n=1 Tax=Cladocopium goreaui TaxID=2562237 RepID=A0A9P1GTI1_9DINO|nr:unnamed protein product [Cladocopium goreaui]